MDAQRIYKTICDSYLPFGPCGITVDDIQRRIDGFQGPYKYQNEYLFHVCAPFVYKKQAMFDKFLSEQKDNKKEKPRPNKCALSIKVEKENARVSFEWDAFQKKYGDVSYERLSDEAKGAACDLAEKQGIRSKYLKDN